MHVILLCNELLKYSMSALLQKIVEDKIVIHNNQKGKDRGPCLLYVVSSSNRCGLVHNTRVFV